MVTQRTKVVTVWMYARCPECLQTNRIVVDWNNPKKYHKCQLCATITPLGAYKVWMHSNEPMW